MQMQAHIAPAPCSTRARAGAVRCVAARPFTQCSRPPVAASGVATSGALSRRTWGLVSTGILFGTSARSMSPVAAAAGVKGSPSGKDLLIVGPGVLGGVLGKQWTESVPGGAAVGLTNTTTNHGRLTSLGVSPFTRETLPKRQFPYVAFCAPPSGSQDYVGDVKAALAMWDGTGSFLFTSSMGVCSVEDGGSVTEDNCPVSAQGSSPSSEKLLAAEAAVTQAGGNVVRLVGLYHSQRGAHTFFLKMKDVPRFADYTVNLLHYEDAASISAAILRGDGEGPFRGRIFIGCDNHPVTFKAMMDACTSSGVFQGEVNFTLPQGPLGKRVDNSISRKALGGWAPKYASFKDFMFVSKGQDFYAASGLF